MRHVYFSSVRNVLRLDVDDFHTNKSAWGGVLDDNNNRLDPSP